MSSTCYGEMYVHATRGIKPERKAAPIHSPQKRACPQLDIIIPLVSWPSVPLPSETNTASVSQSKLSAPSDSSMPCSQTGCNVHRQDGMFTDRMTCSHTGWHFFFKLCDYFLELFFTYPPHAHALLPHGGEHDQASWPMRFSVTCTVLRRQGL